MDDALWKAIVNCEATFDGRFFYGLISTRIFCRPSCRSRTPLRENVRIFESVEDARGAGFRPCKRCRPDALGPDEELVQSAIEVLKQRYRDKLPLDVLARELTISPYHLHRVFKRLTGTTPAHYLLERRLQVAEEALRSESFRSITDIALEAGFRSMSHFSTTFQKKTGHSPSDYRKLHANA